MNEVIIIVTAIIFYFLGKYSQTQKEKKIIIEAIKKIKKEEEKIKPGVIPFKSHKELEYDKSVKKKIDDEWKRSFEEAGFKL